MSAPWDFHLPPAFRVVMADNGGWVLYGHPEEGCYPEMLAAFSDWAQLLECLQKCAVPTQRPS